MAKAPDLFEPPFHVHKLGQESLNCWAVLRTQWSNTEGHRSRSGTEAGVWAFGRSWLNFEQPPCQRRGQPQEFNSPQLRTASMITTDTFAEGSIHDKGPFPVPSILLSPKAHFGY